MPKFLFLLLSSTIYISISYILSFIVYQDLFEKRIKTKSQPDSIFYHYESSNKAGEDYPPIPNTQFPYKFSYLNIDNTNFLNFSSLACKPITFGYSVAEGEKVFPKFEYPLCSDLNNIKKPKASINTDSHQITMNCKDSETGHYYSGPIENYKLMKVDQTKLIPLKTYKEVVVDAENLEFVLGSCDKKTDKTSKPTKKNDNLIHAGMNPIFNEPLYKESLKKLAGTSKIIIMATMDSMSRRHFYRKLPKVVKYLNESEKTLPKMALFDFKLHTTYGADTTGNQVPIFGGRNFRSHQTHDQSEDRLGQFALWSKMKSKGFITMLGLDDCDAGFPRHLGYNIEVDHAVRQFYCLVDVHAGVKTAKNSTEQRCIGPHQSHYYLLNYTLRFVQMYQGANLFIYLHLNAAHEKTGQHAATLDSDMRSFLEKFFELTENSEIFMLLGADHGMRYGHWYNTIDSYQETKLPSMFVISSQTLISKYPFAFNILEENSKRLTSKLDIRETLLSLIELPEHESTAINWLTQISPYSRTCKDLDSNLLYCACSPLREILKYNKTVKKVISVIQEHTQKIFNQKSYFFPEHPPGKFCEFVKINRVLKFYHLEVDKELEIFKIEFGSGKFPLVRIEVNALIGANQFLVDDNASIYKPINFAIGGYRYRIRVRFK